MVIQASYQILSKNEELLRLAKNLIYRDQIVLSRPSLVQFLAETDDLSKGIFFYNTQKTMVVNLSITSTVT